MKNTTIITVLVLFSFGFSQMGRTGLPQPHIFFDDVYPQDEENIDLPEGEKISHFPNSTRTDRTPWEEVSPINGAAINEITVSISDPNIVYATTYGNGVFKSTDAGNTWNPTALINEMGTNDGLAISPIDPNVVFASFYNSGHYTGGTYKTLDGGETWTPIEYFGNTYVQGIFIDPSNPQTIFTYRGQTNYYGYEYSTDGGETWAYNDLYNIDSSSIRIYGFHGDPEDSSVVFAHGSRGKVFRIIDNGSTGTIEHDVLELAYSLGSMDISESNPDHIYLGTSDGFLFTLDGGNSWTLLNEEFGYDPYNDDSTIPNSTTVYDVVVHPENDNEVWFQSRDFGPFRSLDGGFTIESMMPPIMDTHGYELAFSSTDGHVLFGPWWKGLWRFDGESWLESSDGLKHQFIRDLFITEDMEIWSGNDRHAVSKSNDNGITWAHYNSGMESWYNRAMSVDPSGEHALANTNAGPYMTSNSGSDWTNTDDQLDYRMGFYRSNAEPNTVYAAGYELMDSYYGTTTNWKIMRSENQGQDWDTSLEFSVPEDYRIYEMGVDHGDANNLVAIVLYSGNGYSGDVEYTTWFSDDGGESWNSDNININDFLSFGMRSFIRINSEWYCGTWGYGFYKYSNGWQQIGYGLPENAYLVQMLYNPLPDNALYVVTWGAGVYVSYDLGETFEPMNDGLTNLGVLSIGSGITDEGLVTMVGTYGGNYKIVQSSAPEISIDPDTLDFGLVYIGYPDTLDLTVFNEGLSALTVESIDVDGDGFSLASGQNFPIEVFAPSPLNVSVVFGGDTQGTYAGTLTITSNDGDETPLIVSLYGSLAGPPIITVTPDSLYSALFTGETETQILQLANNGSNDLHFSINLLNVNARFHVNIEPGNGPTFSIQDVQGFWNLDHEYSSSGSGRPGTTTSTRTTRSWQLLANDPQDHNSPYDTENIYYEITDTSLNFKYEYYEPWEDAGGNTVAVVFLNIDNDTETGETIEGYELIWEGIDAIIYSIGLDDFEDGIYLYNTEDYYGYGEFVFYEPLAWRVAEDNTNEFSFAVSNELFQGLTSSRIASWSGSFFDNDPDIVPNEGMLELTFRPLWLSVSPMEGEIESGVSLDLGVTFDAAGLFGGDYHALIQINSNDPSTPEFDLPAHLNVTGAPNVSLDSNNINFGTTFVNNIDTLTLVITNDGTDVLDISSITIDNSVFGLSLSSATIDYGSSTQLEITFSPLEAGDYNGLITIISNDSDESTLDVSVSGIGAEPPIIAVTPDSLYSALFTGETDTQILTITNEGGSDLEWSATIRGRRSAIVPTRNGPVPRPTISRDNHQTIILDEMDEDINIKLWENNSSSTARNPRDFELDIGDLVVSATMDNQSTTCYSIDPDGELSTIAENVQQAIVVEDDGSIIYSYFDYYLVYLMRLNPNETTDVVASFEQWGGDFDIDEEGNIVYITNTDLFLVTPDGVVEQVVSSGFESADAVAVHPLTGDYYIGDTGISSIIRVTPEGEIYNIYQDYSSLPNIEGLSFTPTGTLIIADEDAQAIYSFDGTELTTIAQGGLIDEPEDVVVDRDGNYIVPLDTYNGYESSLGSIIKVTPEGEVTYLAQQVFYYIDNIGIYQSRISWLSFQEESGVIPAGSSENINVLFDAAGLFGGDYHAVIQINSNDPSTPEFDLPAHLSVTGAPNINVETDSIDFGVTYTNFGGTEQISIGNNGTDVLEVSGITVDNDVFSLSESNATVGYGDEFTLEVEFLPLESGDHSGTITIVSNDSNEPEITIVLVGNSIAPPVINVSPDSLYSALSTGETETQIITILNNGMSDLEYDINIYGSADGDPYALGFNGSNNYVSFDNQTIQSMIGGNWANEKTISAWIKPVGSSPNISGGWEGDAIYGQASGSGNFFGISRGIIGGEDRIWVYNWDGNDDRIGIEYENFEWVHIALVQDNGMLYGYKNGELIGQVNTGASETAGYQRIGGGTDNGGYFQGFLDEIRIWSVARTQDEIQSNTSHELSGDEDNLVGYWKFNEGAGTLVNDETANGNHGSVIGASWIFSDAVVYTSWIGVSPANGIIVPGASSDINLEFNAQDLDAGTYTASLLINSNDPVSPVINIPATLEIEFLGNDNAGLIPAEFALYQNYPNPFNPVTTIQFDIPVETHHNTSLQIFDITGHTVETLVNEKLEPGQHKIQWNASQHSSGVYFLRMETSLFTKTQKMILLK